MTIRSPPHTALTASASLAQIGEFSCSTMANYALACHGVPQDARRV